MHHRIEVSIDMLAIVIFFLSLVSMLKEVVHDIRTRSTSQRSIIVVDLDQRSTNSLDNVNPAGSHIQPCTAFRYCRVKTGVKFP
jgi:hypothetical protein